MKMFPRLMVMVILITLSRSDDPIIQSPLGLIRGLEIQDKESGKTVHEFRGIRYAKAPTGELRFRKPEPIDAWKQEYGATKFGNACPQTILPLINDMSESQSEDCLFLNVYVPQSVTKNEKMPIMLWIHGGGFMMGNGFFYDGTRVAVDGNVIVVTINYRLGLLGFLGLHHPASRGNYGLWDQITALQWIQRNIASFGGDPGSVTIFGESAGGWSVCYLSVIPSNKGLFHRAIAQSGGISSFVFPGRKEVDRIIKHVSEKTNCVAENKYNFVDCLRKADLETLLKTSHSLQYDSSELLVEYFLGPVVDGELIPDHPLKMLNDLNSPQSKFFSSLDFVTGTTSQEGSLLCIFITQELQKQHDFHVRIIIPLNVLCNAVIKPYVDYFYNGSQEIQNKMCRFYTSYLSDEEQSNRAADFFGDVLFNPWVAHVLSYHSRLQAGRTYQYVVSRPSPVPFAHLHIPPPPWFKGCGHADELFYLFATKYQRYIVRG